MSEFLRDRPPRPSTWRCWRPSRTASGSDPTRPRWSAQLATSGARVQLALAPAGSGKTVTAAHPRDRVGRRTATPSSASPRPPRRPASCARNSATASPQPTRSPSSSTPSRTGTRRPRLGRRDRSRQPADRRRGGHGRHARPRRRRRLRRASAARPYGSSATTGNSPRSAPAGVLRDIERTHGAVTLAEVRRFTHADGSPNRAEAAASLALRRGDPTGLGYYLDHGRIHVGDNTTTADQAFAAWAADRAAGLDALLIASTNDQVRELNLRAQAARLAAADSSGRASRHARRRHDGQRRRRDHHPPQRPSPRAVGHRLGRQRRPVDRHLGPSRRRARGAAFALPHGGSRCRPTTPPSTSNSATPPPCTARRGRPSTPATPS